MTKANLEALKARFRGSQLTVDSNVMIEKAGEVREAIKRMQNAFDNIENAVRKTAGYWEGAAGDYYRNMYYEKKDEVQEILNRLNEHPGELELMANNYVQVENRATEDNSKLRNDYI